MRKFFLGLLFTTFQYVLFSQAIIRGKVVEKQTNEGLAGATVAIKGSAASVITDNGGNFLLQKVKPGKLILTISYVGYERVELPVEVVDDSTYFLNVPLSVDARVGSTVVLTATSRPEKIVNAPASISVSGGNGFGW